MNQVMKIDKQVTMSSREIADICEKLHRNVVRDIQRMIKELKLDVLSFEHIYQDSQNRSQTEYLLPRDLTETLLTGYSIPLRHRVVTRLRELESVSQPRSMIPQTLPEALRLAADMAEQNSHLRLVVDEQQPKVEALERIAVACGSMCLTDAAKQLGVQRIHLLNWMAANRWIYRRSGSARWIAFDPRLRAGLLEHKVTVISPGDELEERIASQVRVTAKGLSVLAQKMGVRS
ncbi:phage antirepressor KilAC domain-containing protein [Pseudomonas sp. NPDC078700]|uniref:phage antirepressor KilAC domain-containing protein n=1 Tax=Pseudomonas sp. NPDC078700 TaxID=3364424 RepID=UPI0037C65676